MFKLINSSPLSRFSLVVRLCSCEWSYKEETLLCYNKRQCSVAGCCSSWLAGCRAERARRRKSTISQTYFPIKVKLGICSKFMSHNCGSTVAEQLWWWPFRCCWNIYLETYSAGGGSALLHLKRNASARKAEKSKSTP